MKNPCCALAIQMWQGGWVSWSLLQNLQKDATDHFFVHNLKNDYVKTLVTLPHALKINTFYYVNGQKLIS